jgi:hypothetical protein
MIIVSERKEIKREAVPTISQIASGSTAVKSLATKVYKDIQKDIQSDRNKFTGDQAVPYYDARNMIVAIMIGVLEQDSFIRNFFYRESQPYVQEHINNFFVDLRKDCENLLQKHWKGLGAQALE